MKLLKRTIYLLYYIKETDWKQTRIFLNYAVSVTGKFKLTLLADCLISVYRYNISIKDYFCFRFYSLNTSERHNWAGTGYMYEYQRKMNPPEYRTILEDKIAFLKSYKKFVTRSFFTINELENNSKTAEELLKNPSGRAVLKGSHGQVGAQVEVIQCHDYDRDKLLVYMKRKSYDLAEQYVVQHASLMSLSPSALNTVRIFTQLSEDRVDFLGARLRISVNSPVDNMAAGNLAASVNEVTGIVDGPGVYSDITKEEKTTHPLTGLPITGFKIPHWEAIKTMVHDAALLHPQNKSVGWDIAVTETGAELIEGNHNWCKLLWQLPVKRGLKQELEKYL